MINMLISRAKHGVTREAMEWSGNLEVCCNMCNFRAGAVQSERVCRCLRGGFQTLSHVQRHGHSISPSLGDASKGAFTKLQQGQKGTTYRPGGRDESPPGLRMRKRAGRESRQTAA